MDDILDPLRWIPVLLRPSKSGIGTRKGGSAHVTTTSVPFFDRHPHTDSTTPVPILWLAALHARHIGAALGRIAANVVRHARYLTFQLAEVAVPRHLFGLLLRRIDRLRQVANPPPSQPMQT